MSYYFNATISGKDFNDVIELVTEELKKEGFGILTEIDVQATFKKKLDIDFKKYRILGACNPPSAFKAITSEDKIGVFLPCNVVVTENESGDVEVSAVDPVASMMAANNETLGEVAVDIQSRLKKVISNLN